jgi:predicted naringenin-chalcone synthase
LTTAHINRIATAVPPHDVHAAFIEFAYSLLQADQQNVLLFKRMAKKAGIEHRYSYFQPALDGEGRYIDDKGFYTRNRFPDTASRMRLFAAWAPELAQAAVEKLLSADERGEITHLIITCCTGFSAPGIDLELIERCGLPSGIERTMIGFMGCYAAINALKLARHIVRSEASSRVVVLNLELCTLHLKETTDLEEMLAFLLFGDGCAASLVTAEPFGVALDSFNALLVPDTRELITWNIGKQGFDMILSGQVPAGIVAGLQAGKSKILGNLAPSAVDLWAVHPGGRTVLDAVERAFELPQEMLAPSREILRHYGNMSSGTVMFVLESLLQAAPKNEARGANGCAMSFGPGLVAETMRFHMA